MIVCFMVTFLQELCLLVEYACNNITSASMLYTWLCLQPTVQEFSQTSACLLAITIRVLIYFFPSMM
jgi:hypothetical protein